MDDDSSLTAPENPQTVIQPPLWKVRSRAVAVAGVAAALLAPAVALACLWDRDTLATEGRNRPDTIAAITGRFPRNPPLFYTMRLERVSAEVVRHPERLDAYDDAGVACDRLGRGDEAVAWMGRKREQLRTLDGGRPEVREHYYRYHANLGTFLAHRWIRNGADRTHLDDLHQAHDAIATALALNPNAHFGRERYQLQAIAFLIHPPEPAPYDTTLPNLLGWSFDDIYAEATAPDEAADAVRGLTGLIVLGNAWESVDVFHALNVALQRDSADGFERGRDGGRNSLAYLAYLRCRELIDHGARSLVPGTPQGPDLVARLRRPDFIDTLWGLDRAYADLRREADAWQNARTAFVLTRLRQGRHPDTDPTFWRGYTEAPRPRLPEVSVPQTFHDSLARRAHIALALLIGMGVSLVLGIVWIRFHLRRRRLRPGAKAPAGLEV
jgi:hypothetical protein